MRHFCTYFDCNYLVRALALYRSLERYCPSFRLYVLCLDDKCQEILKQCDLPNVILIPLKEVESEYPDLPKCKTNRSRIEYYYTCSPCLPLFVLTKNPAIEIVTYLDADLYFYDSPEPLFDELGDGSIAIIEHKYAPGLESFEANGKYNVGWISFRNDSNGLGCVRWWQERCLEWCYERNEDGKYSDQGYLNEWPERFSGVRVIQHKGANVAPWNVANYTLTCRDDRLLVDDAPLLFFHFHGFKKLASGLYDSNLARSGAKLGPVLRQRVYGAYIQELDRQAIHGPPTASVRKASDRYGLFVRWVRTCFRVAATVFSGAYVFQYKGRVF